MAKRIALFLDGTWNKTRPDTRATNVQRLFEATDGVVDGDIAHSDHVKKYLKGVGTPRDFLALKNWYCDPRVVLDYLSHPVDAAALIAGGAGGWGIGDQIKAAYAYLSEQYARWRGAEVYLFGFSRGAYAARSLAGFVDRVGLLLQDKEHLVGNAFALYQAGGRREQSALKEYLRKMVESEGPSDEQTLPVYFIGVWDTVGSLGFPRWLEAITRPHTDYHQVDLPFNVTHARHALALHELRKDYRPTLWRGKHPRSSSQTLRQCWFAGAHADVGGGYSETGLADLALIWMAEEAARVSAGTPPMFWSRTTLAPAIGDTVVHQESGGLWRVLGPVIREELTKRGRPIGETWDSFYGHASASQRLSSPAAVNYGGEIHSFAESLREVDRLTAAMLSDIQVGGRALL